MATKSKAPAGRRIVIWMAYAVLLIVCFAAIAGPSLYPHDPWNIAGDPYLPPLSPGHLLGTDTLGRDILAGIIHGSRVSLLLGLSSTLAAVVFGCLLGSLAGYYGGRVDTGLNVVIEFFQAIPNFLLAIMVVALFEPSLTTNLIAIAVVTWPGVARLVRGEFMSLRRREYVAAAKMSQLSDARIIFGEILPNCLPTIIVAAGLMVATAILLESALSFLGLGDPNFYSWGFMIGASRNVIRDAWWMSTLPGIAIFLTVLAINLASDGLNEYLNPRNAPV